MTGTLTRPAPPAVGAIRRRRALAAAVAATAGAGALGYVGLRDPRSSVVPQCPWHWATGLECPGCGGLRMTHDLLHGDLGRAFADNAVLLVLAPVLLFLLARATWRWLRAEPVAHRGRFEVRGALGVTLAVVGIAWGLLRNLA